MRNEDDGICLSSFSCSLLQADPASCVKSISAAVGDGSEKVANCRGENGQRPVSDPGLRTWDGLVQSPLLHDAPGKAAGGGVLQDAGF